ncbi:MAG: DUF5329 family protein [Bacteroidota bacterium]|nr:DUF5329 family protein [Bacteroidota bacterium]
MKQMLMILITLTGGSDLGYCVNTIGGPLIVPTVLSEEQKITQLINYIEKLDAKFIRNGSEYTPVDAAKHLRMKREKAGKKIKTAKDFIDCIASKSSMSGEPYQIKYANGLKLNVRDVLYYELKKVESKHAGNFRNVRVASNPVCLAG